MEDFKSWYFPETGDAKRLVYEQGEGRAVIVMHELPGMIPECVDLARRLAQDGFRVYLPLLFGKPNQPLSISQMLANTVKICISQEFYAFARNQSSPITDWLKALCRKAQQDTGGKGVGVIGMCLTGGFVLSLMADESVIAPVASQPSLPFGITSAQKASLGISPEALQSAKQRASQGVPVLALRFSEDKISPPQKLTTLRDEFALENEIIEDNTELCWKRGTSLETIEINSKPDNPYQISQNAHATLTLEYNQDSDHPTHRVYRRVVEFLKEQFAKYP
jgi:dienelactone hydrolase